MAASYGAAVFFFPQTGETLEKDIYLDDTAGAPVRWDGGSGASATSDTDFKMPANGRLVEVVIAAATGQTKTLINRNNTSTGNMLRNSVHLVTVAIKRPMSIIFNTGDKVSMTQLA